MSVSKNRGFPVLHGQRLTVCERTQRNSHPTDSRHRSNPVCAATSLGNSRRIDLCFAVPSQIKCFRFDLTMPVREGCRFPVETTSSLTPAARPGRCDHFPRHADIFSASWRAGGDGCCPAHSPRFSMSLLAPTTAGMLLSRFTS
jgi:hypothetical protein